MVNGGYAEACSDGIAALHNKYDVTVLERRYIFDLFREELVVSSFIRPVEFLSITFGTIFVVAVGMVF